jgi:hypothetical protein
MDQFEMFFYVITDEVPWFQGRIFISSLSIIDQFEMFLLYYYGPVLLTR